MPSGTETSKRCERALLRLLEYCRGQAWAGYDPYDGLNSPLVAALPFKQKIARTAIIQLLKRSPVNLRPLLGVKKALNAKGVALGARALLLLSSHYRAARQSYSLSAPSHEFIGKLESDLAFLLGALSDLRSRAYSEACWGYNFDWQSRAFFAPRGTPNVVCTTFAAHAYLDWYEESGDGRALETAVSSCEFLLKRLNRARAGDAHCFSYTPLDDSRVHNVNMLAAELLARAYGLSRREEFREASERAARYTLAHQREDGSWVYGEASSQGWIDSFHTGFILVSLKRVIEQLGAREWQPRLKAAYEFYEARFFLADFTPKYYHDKLYPVDVHSAAQAVITFVEMTDLMPEANHKAARAVDWAIKNLQDPSGHFHFQRHRFYTIKIPYMRWGQLWMLYALSLYLSRNPVGDNV